MYSVLKSHKHDVCNLQCNFLWCILDY